MRKETSELIVKAMFDMHKKYGNEYFKHSDLVDTLKSLGYTEQYKGYHNTNIVYSKSDSDLVIVMVDSPSKGLFKPILVDKATYDDYLKNSNIFFVSAHKDRPGFWLHGKVVKLHKVIINPKPGMEIDHINHCHCSCLKEDLRLATRLENLANRPYRCHINIINRTFWVRVYLDTENKEEKLLEYLKLGFSFEFTKYGTIILKSPMFSSKVKMYQCVNKIEHDFFGEFTYNPIADYEHPISLDLYIRHKLGIITKEELNMLQTEVVRHLRGQRALDYYQLAV